MAPRRTNDGVIEIQITTPKDMSQGKATKVKIKFTSDDFSITWLDFFRKHHKSLASFLSNKKDQYIVHDHRNTNRHMNVWMLNSTVKDYINSFKKTLSLYRATVAKRTATMPKPHHVGPARRVSIPTPAATPSRNAVAGPGTNSRGSSNGTRNLPTPSASMKRPAPPGNNNARVVKFPRTVDEEVNIRVNRSRANTASPPRAPVATQVNRNSFLNIDRDDNISMANSIDSQDSQLDDLVQQGVEITDIKGKVIQNVVKHVDNVTMLRMKKELQSLIDSGRWLRITGRMPVTATALQLVFGLSTNTGR